MIKEANACVHADLLIKLGIEIKVQVNVRLVCFSGNGCCAGGHNMQWDRVYVVSPKKEKTAHTDVIQIRVMDSDASHTEKEAQFHGGVKLPSTHAA